MNIKKLIIIFISIFFISNSCINIYASSNSTKSYVTSVSVSEYKNNVKISGYIPNIINLSNPVFQYKVNQAITQEYNNKISQASNKKIKSLKFSFETIIDNNIISVLLYSSDLNTSITDISSFVLNKSTNSYIEINDILGTNGINYANKVISNKINTDNKTKYTSIPVINEKQSFYVKNSNIVIIFGTGKIAPVSKSTQRFEIPKDKIKNVTVKSYYTKPQYNVKMIPVRSVLQQFGYSISWNGTTNTITASKGNLSTKIIINKNKYYKNNIYPKQLEFAPEILDGITYVPISFFSEMLNMLIAVDSSGNVTISEYSL